MELRGRWVLVTGASSGLGREMAKILAVTYGAHLVIVARREERLNELKRELEQNAGVKIEICVADLSKLATTLGPRFAPGERLAEMARQNGRFYQD